MQTNMIGQGRNNIIIYGAGNVAKKAFWELRQNNNILFFVDSNPAKQGTSLFGREVCAPSVLQGHLDTCVVIGSTSYENEIYDSLKKRGIKNICKTFEWMSGRDSGIRYLLDELNEHRSIDLGKFLQEFSPLYIGDMTFVSGGSSVLDYAFLYAIAKKFKINSYLEIGSYIGESVNLMSGLCDICYSMTAEPGGDYSMDSFCRKFNIPDYSERLSYKENIRHIYCNSQKYDFSLIKDKIDLYFIDADHSYQGVYSDTKNVFSHKAEDSIVIWHDFISGGGLNDVVAAVYDFLGEEEFNNVYCTDNNMCGIYLPKKYQSAFSLHSRKYLKGVREKLYTYNTVLTVEINE